MVGTAGETRLVPKPLQLEESGKSPANVLNVLWHRVTYICIHVKGHDGADSMNSYANDDELWPIFLLDLNDKNVSL